MTMVNCGSRIAPALLCVGLMLAGCSDMGKLQQATAPMPTPRPKPAMVQSTPASDREHERIFATYGGAYEDPQLEGLISRIVDRLVAASDPPEQGYKVTILK